MKNQKLRQKMKYKNMKKRLESGQKAWDNLPQKDKAASTRPGSIKWR